MSNITNRLCLWLVLSQIIVGCASGMRSFNGDYIREQLPLLSSTVELTLLSKYRIKKYSYEEGVFYVLSNKEGSYIIVSEGDLLQFEEDAFIPTCKIEESNRIILKGKEKRLYWRKDTHGSVRLYYGKVSSKHRHYFDWVFDCVVITPNRTTHYYQRDHLGSELAVVDEAGTLENTNSYSAFGSVTNASAAYALNRYKYNGKELEHTHGIDCLDYGARWYEPVIGRFTTMDPLSEKYYNISPYAYCGNNPVNAIDEDGRKIVFVNGYLGFGSPKGGETYWNGRYSSFVRGAQSTLNDYNTPFFTDYDYNYMGSASLLRELQGYQYAKDNYKALIKGMKPIVDKFNFVSHSMGGAFSEGMIRYLAEQGWETNNAVFLNAWEPLLIYNKKERNRIDATCTNDPVQFLSTPIFGEPDIPSSDIKIRIKSNESVLYIHRDLIDGNNGYLWNLINDFLAK